MTLLFLLLLLFVPYLSLTLAGRLFDGFRVSPGARARVGLSLLLLFTAGGHFFKAEEMATMLPPAFPNRVGIVYLTGVFELLGAVGVWPPRLRRLAGLCLIIMLAGFLPANIYSAANGVEFGGHGGGMAYLLVRVPFQFFLIWWVFLATRRRSYAGQLQTA